MNNLRIDSKIRISYAHVSFISHIVRLQYWFFTRKFVNFQGILGSIETDTVFLSPNKISTLHHIRIIFLPTILLSMYFTVIPTVDDGVYNFWNSHIFLISGLLFVLISTVAVLYMSNLRIYSKHNKTITRLGQPLISIIIISPLTQIVYWAIFNNSKLYDVIIQNNYLLFFISVLAITFTCFITSKITLTYFIPFLINDKSVTFKDFEPQDC